jgi:hypothetical protein
MTLRVSSKGDVWVPCKLFSGEFIIIVRVKEGPTLFEFFVTAFREVSPVSSSGLFFLQRVIEIFVEWSEKIINFRIDIIIIFFFQVFLWGCKDCSKLFC